MPLSIDLQGTVIISGGNRGLGFAISKLVAKSGANVAILFRGSKDAHDRAADIAKEFNVKAKAYQCDVGDEKRVNDVYEEITKDFGQITGLVANAGVSVPKPAFEQDASSFDYVMKTNVLGTFNLAKVVAKKWSTTGFKKGSIVVVSSMSSQIYNVQSAGEPLPQIFYNASKAAVSSIAKGLAAEWAPYGIRVNILSPGFIKTDQTQSMLKSLKYI